jgi:hypothetical protein
MTRYPLAPLCEALHCRPDDLKARFGLDHRQISRYLERGIPEESADRLVSAAGLHLWHVWPDLVDDPTRECASTDCTSRFVPHDRAPHALYCSPRCRQREKARRYRARAHGAETNRRHRRAYYAENRSYELGLKRRERAARAARRARDEEENAA